MNKIRTFLCLFIFLPFSLFAAERLEWSADENVFEYKVEVKNKASGEVKSYTTQENFIDLAEASGDYEFRVKALDMLGRESAVSEWQSFKISRALTPVLTGMPLSAERPLGSLMLIFHSPLFSWGTLIPLAEAIPAEDSSTSWPSTTSFVC